MFSGIFQFNYLSNYLLCRKQYYPPSGQIYRGFYPPWPWVFFNLDNGYTGLRKTPVYNQVKHVYWNRNVI